MSVPRGRGHPGPGQVSPQPNARSQRLLARAAPHPCSPILIPRFFRRLDKDDSRSLDAGELRQGLGQLGLEVGEAEAEALCRRWDRDGSGTLDLDEFLRALRVRPASEAEGGAGEGASTPSITVPPQPPMSQAREAVVAAAFAKLDRTGDGVVTVDDLRGVYSGRAHPKVRSGEWTEDEALHQFLDNFDTSEKDGQVCSLGPSHRGSMPGLGPPSRRAPPQVTLAEFQDYYSGLSASVDTDSEFVAVVSSAWRL